MPTVRLENVKVWKYPQSTIDRVVELFDAGATWREMQDELHIGGITAKALYESTGRKYQSAKKKFVLTENEITQIRTMQAQGRGGKFIAKTLGKPAASLRLWLWKNEERLPEEVVARMRKINNSRKINPIAVNSKRLEHAMALAYQMVDIPTNTYNL